MVSKVDPLEDGISSVEIIDYMGSDLTVVNAARVSMAKTSDWDEQGDLPQGDANLIRYLAKHGHWTPFSQPQIQFRIKMPIFVARQWFKHQIGFTRNEVSRRYVDDTPELFFPKVWRGRAANVKQGSSDEEMTCLRGRSPDNVVRSHADSCVLLYEDMIRDGFAPEQARMVLPQQMYTEFVETGSLAAYCRLAKLRLDPHAQLEVRKYGQAVADCIQPRFPVSWGELISAN
jgi:thymidylate synthase (FAD)